jgi:hypothetical protein
VGASSSGAPVRLQVCLQAAGSGIEGRNRGAQGESNEENICFVPRGRYVASFLGMSAFEKVMYE